MLREQAQKALLGDGLLTEDAQLRPFQDPSDQSAAATAPPLRGTAANDRLRGTNDDELIQGFAGDDTLIGRRGADRLLGQAGNDNLTGSGGADTLIGGAGNDRLKGGGGSDNLKGGGGDDTLLGGGGADTLKGGGGEDSLNGGGGSDLLAGGGKSDTLDGSRGNDTLKGGGGDDLILGGVGSDQIAGGGGADTIRYRNADFAKGEVDVIISFKTGEDKVDLSAVTIPAEGLGFVLIDGSVALEIAGGRLVFRGITDPALLAPEDFVLPDGAAPINFSLPTTAPPVPENRAPAVSNAVESGALETDLAFSINLLSGASDPDEGDVLSVTDLSLTSGDASGISFAGAALNVDPAAYQRLAAGQTEVITYAYKVSDDDGAFVAQTATVTISGVNDAPVTAGQIAASASEDDAGFTVDLLTGASDPDAEADLSVDGLTKVSGDDRGVVFNGVTLEVDPGAYNDLGADGVDTIVFSYNVTDGVGGVVAQTATITINGRNDAPTVAAEVRGGGVANGEIFSVDLLDGAGDADVGDSLTISGLQVISGDATGIQEGADSLVVDPSTFIGLGGNQDLEIVYAYAIVDGSGASVEQTATITIVGANDAPVVSETLTAEASEDDASFSVDLLQDASDPDTGDFLSVANFARISGDTAGVVLVGNRLDIDPDAYNRLNAGDEQSIAYRYDVVDGKGGSTPQFITITITGVNDAPVASSELRVGGSESGGDFTVNLLDGAEDPDDGDVLGVRGVSLVSGDGSGVTVGASNLSVNVSAYESLGFSDVETIRYSYQISDSAGAAISRTAEITIIGENDAPTAGGPVTASATEFDASFSVDLLQGASDPDSGDVVSTGNLRLTGGDDAGVAIVGDTLFVNPELYRNLIAGEQEVITYAYDLIDGNGGATTQTAEIAINGADQFRTVMDSDLAAEITGSPERDQIFGNGGDDTIIGGAGDDLIFGGADNDVIGTSVGRDLLSGGEGQDRFVIKFADEANELFDTTPDIIADFNQILDKLDFREVIGPTDSFEETVGFSYDPVLDQTTVDILGTDVVILEGVSQSFQQFLDNGNLAFERANFHFEGNNFGLANEAIAGEFASSIILPPLDFDEFYELTGSTGGGSVSLFGDELFLDPTDIVLGADEFSSVTAFISHFDRFGVEATAEAFWSVRPGDQPPTFTGETFTISEDVTDFRWNLTDFADDDFFAFDFFDNPTLAFDIVTVPDFGTVTIEANGETSIFGGSSIIVSEGETVSSTFTLGDNVPEIREDETLSVGIEFVVRDQTFFDIFTTFTIDIQGAPDDLGIDSGPLASAFQFDGDIDTFVVQLEEGVEYAFEARGADTGEGTVADPILTLLDDSFDFIAEDDNSGVGENALIRFTADRTGVFNLQVEGSAPVAGDYVVEATRPDDFGETFATAGQTFPGQFVFGQLEAPGDLDFIAIFLEAGANYQFDLLGEPSGAGTLSDPLLRLQNAIGDELAVNDDLVVPIGFPGSLESQILFTPEVSDTYVLVVDSFNSSFTGTWQLSAFEFS